MILVTGSRHRLGRVLADALAARGYPLLLHTHQSRETLEERADALRRAGAPDVRTVSVDFGEPDAHEVLHERVLKAAPDLRGAVFNAAVYPHGPLVDADALEVTRTLHINAVVPAMALARLAGLPSFQTAVMITDARAQGAWRNRGPYLASKAALESLVRTAALELAPRVRVHGVAPGPIALEGDDATARERILPRLPLGALVQPEDVARMVCLLLDPAFTSSTGSIWPVDAGRNLDK